MVGRPDRMKVLQVNTERGWRGGERQTLLTALALRELGCQVEILCRRGEPLAAHAQSHRLSVHVVGTRQAACWWLCLNSRKYDVIHVQTANALTWAVLAKCVHRTPIVFTRRTSFDVKSDWSTGLKWRQVDALVAISEAAAAEPRRLGLNVSIIRSAVPPVAHDESTVQAYLAKHGLEGKTLVGTSAALSPEKGALTLVKAAYAVCRERPDVLFIHWGAAGHQSERVKQEIARLGLESRCRLMGFQRDVEVLYPILSAFVMASRQEALGSSVLDAMQAGVPVVSTDAGGLKETLGEGRGLLGPVDDADAMAASIMAVLSHSDRMREMTVRAHDYVTREHGVAEMANRYLSLYRSCVGKSGS